MSWLTQALRLHQRMEAHLSSKFSVLFSSMMWYSTPLPAKCKRNSVHVRLSCVLHDFPFGIRCGNCFPSHIVSRLYVTSNTWKHIFSKVYPRFPSQSMTLDCTPLLFRALLFFLRQPVSIPPKIIVRNHVDFSANRLNPHI